MPCIFKPCKPSDRVSKKGVYQGERGGGEAGKRGVCVVQSFTAPRPCTKQKVVLLAIFRVDEASKHVLLRHPSFRVLLTTSCSLNMFRKLCNQQQA